ncbi:unnamed protein product [Pedinophyceae sp. YPF-701]|nr:unnamed protein product [Pedinophyceae sp. YPF-701]
MADEGPRKGLEMYEEELQLAEALEREFQGVLTELLGDESLQRFRVEYEKLFRALKKSHDKERKLVKKCREMHAELVANAAKVQAALKLSEEDQATISALKREIEKAWAEVDDARDKEARAKEQVATLRHDVTSLNRMVEDSTGIKVPEDDMVQELLTEKEDLTRERDDLLDQIMRQRAEVVEINEKLRRTEQDKLDLLDEVSRIRGQVAEKRAEGEKEVRRRERLEREVKDLKAALEMRQNELKARQAAVGQAEEEVMRMEVTVKESAGQYDRMKREYNALSEKVQKLHHDLDEQIHQNTQLLAENSQRQVELKLKEDEIAAVRLELTKMGKLREAALTRMKHIEKQRIDAERQRDALRQEIQQTEREMDNMSREVDAERKKQDELVRERDVLNKMKTSAENSTQKQQDLIRIVENNKRNLEHEIDGYRVEAQRQARIIHQLEKERDKLSAEAAEASSKYVAALEEVKVRDLAVVDLQKKIAEAESRLKQQQNLYEAVRSDRNLYSKNLVEAQDEIQEMKRKFKIMSHQIEQLKEEIAAKDLALVKEHFDHMKVEKEKEGLKLELNKAKQQIRDTEAVIVNQKAELQKLNHIINEADQERARQRKEYDIAVNERDILGTQLIRRNDELALLYEKIKIQQSTLQKGQIQYRDRLNEIRVLKIKLNDLRRELHVLRTSVSNIDMLKREVHHLSRDLLRERAKVKALSEELETPMNVHRWRKLEGSDPATYEMIQKIQTLQKRLIAKTEEVVEKDLLIQEKEKLYLELKNILARQPGPEVAEQLSVYQASLKEKSRQLKSMASELNMYQAQVNEHKYEIERLVRELNDVKRKYFEQKKREQLERQRMASTAPGPGADAGSGGPSRFTGGGFSLTQGAS